MCSWCVPGPPPDLAMNCLARVIPSERRLFGVGLRGLEPLTSALSVRLGRIASLRRRSTSARRHPMPSPRLLLEERFAAFPLRPRLVGTCGQGPRGESGCVDLYGDGYPAGDH